MVVWPNKAQLHGAVRMSSWAGLVALVATSLLLLACQTNAASVPTATSFIIRLAPDQLDQVAANVTQQGYTILQKSRKYGFLVVSQHAAPTAAPAADGQSKAPSWQRPLPNNQVNSGDSTSSSSSTSVSVTWYLQLGLLKQPAAVSHAGSAAAAAAATAASGLQQLPSYSSRHNTAGTLAAAADAVGLVDAAAVSQQLTQVPGVQSVERNSYMWLLDQPHGKHLHRQLLQHVAQQQQQQDSSPEASFHPAATPAADNLQNYATVCSEMISYNPDLQGRETEGSPYGITLVEADSEELIAISKQHRNKIMWCVLDTGLDRTNPEFDPDTTSGCQPGVRRSDGSMHACQFPWFDDADGHGTHTSGSIGARRNGQGIVGVSAEGAHMYHYNIFGPNEYFSLPDAVTAWDDCISELDARKAATAMPDMKLVISMSFGGNESASIMEAALDAILQERSDVLFVAAAGNSGTSELSYPAAYPQVVSVGAVAWDDEVTDFSSYNADVEWAAPGLGILSTVPLWSVHNNTNGYNSFVRMSVTTAYAFASSDIFTKPPLAIMDGSARGSVTGAVFDCGFANETCTGATGKVCLIQETTMRYCTQMLNCLAGGGIAAIFYAGVGRRSACDMVFGIFQCNGGYKPPHLGWPIAVTAALVQGQALQAALNSNVSVTVTIDTGSGKVPLETLSGTSMATPIAAGVAGLVWSAHTNCSAEAIRAVISKTAKDAAPAGRDHYYGYGIVKALAAHNYLLTNPCIPPAPRDCMGEWQWGNCSQDCGGGTQDAWYVVNVTAKSGGKQCEAQNGELQTRNCNQQRCGVAVDDVVTVVSGEWTALYVFENDRGSFLDVLAPTTPLKGVARLAASDTSGAPMDVQGADLGLIMYKSPAGYMGVDRFSYTVIDTAGQDSTAKVTVNVVAGSCSGNSCSPGGVCYASIGRCQCSKSSGMVATFISNPSAAARKVTPKVPACRYPPFTAVLPFSLTAVKAKRGLKVYMPFVFGGSRQCADGDVVTAISFTEQPSCGGQVGSELLTADARMRTGQLSCKQGKYTYVFRAPGSAGCYRMSVALRDGSSQHTVLKVV